MCRSVPPLQVSPFIRAARWSLLMCGIIYGVFKLQSYRIIESQAKSLREQRYKKKLDQLNECNRYQTSNEVKTFAKEVGITELPPGWEDEL